MRRKDTIEREISYLREKSEQVREILEKRQETTNKSTKIDRNREKRTDRTKMRKVREKFKRDKERKSAALSIWRIDNVERVRMTMEYI